MSSPAQGDDRSELLVRRLGEASSVRIAGATQWQHYDH